MLDYPGFCYLDTEKTGSTFIRSFLRRHAVGVPRDDTKHRPPGPVFWGRKFYFSSARDPFDQYASLYAYGCDGRGAVHGHLWRTGSPVLAAYDGTPEGFFRWLEAMLGPDRRDVIPPSALPVYSDHLGLMGARFLRLNLPGAQMILARARSAGQIRAAYRVIGLPRAVVRTEHLVEDLTDLVRGPLRAHIRDVAAAVADLETAAPENTSAQVVGVGAGDLPADLAARLRALEWFHVRVLGYAVP